MKRFWLLLATGLGTGYAPVASGTAGTLVGIPIVWVMAKLFPPYALLIAAFILLLVGVRAARVAEEHFDKSDAGQIVIDEIVGYMIALYLVPVTFWTLAVGFFLFRFFDIVKIWPARGFDRAPGPWAVMLDDVAAGVYANVALQLLILFGLFSV